MMIELLLMMAYLKNQELVMILEFYRVGVMHNYCGLTIDRYIGKCH